VPIIVDSAEHYKDKKEILNVLSPEKTDCPVILIDPTFKERNAARALSKRTFDRFKKAAKKFLHEPSAEFFELRRVEIGKMKEKAREIRGIFAVFEIKTNKQPGDIAGTKILKFSKLLARELKKKFDIITGDFEYFGVKSGEVYFVLKRKKEIVIEGPSIEMERAVANFKKKHRIWYIEDRKIKSAERTDIGLKEFLKGFKKVHRRTMRQMGIKKVRVV